MTKEQEAIEKLEYYLKNSAYKRENSDFFKNGGWEIVDLEIPKAIETVLNILKEKDVEIEKLKKEDIRLQEELNTENKRCMILANNDKFKEQVIDLMARAIDNYDSQLVINTFKDKEHVKQYFKRRAKE